MTWHEAQLEVMHGCAAHAFRPGASAIARCKATQQPTHACIQAPALWRNHWGRGLPVQMHPGRHPGGFAPFARLPGREESPGWQAASLRGGGGTGVDAMGVREVWDAWWAATCSAVGMHAKQPGARALPICLAGARALPGRQRGSLCNSHPARLASEGIALQVQALQQGRLPCRGQRPAEPVVAHQEQLQALQLCQGCKDQAGDGLDISQAYCSACSTSA